MPVHRRVLVHPGLTHGHVFGQQGSDLAIHTLLLHADHQRDVVAHRVHRVVPLVAVDRPVAGVGDELDVARLARADVDGGLRPLRGRRDLAAVGRDDVEVVAVQVDRMAFLPDVAEADAHPISRLGDQRRRARERPAVEGEEVEVGHDVRVRVGAPRPDEPFVQEDREVPVDHLRALLGMDDEEPHGPEPDLDHLVAVRVVHLSPVLLERELVGERVAGGDVPLVEPAHTVHAARQDNAVPVDRGRLRELVRDQDTDPIALNRLDRRPGRLPVVTPGVHDHAGSDFVPAGFNGEPEHLDAVLHREGQRAAVRRDHRRVGQPLRLRVPSEQACCVQERSGGPAEGRRGQDEQRQAA